MKIALISCGKAKQPGTHEAQNLYIGSYFKKVLAHAKEQCDEVYILSAKYGLLDLTQIITSYELKITQLSKANRTLWGLGIIKQLRSKELHLEEIYLYAGKPYYEPLLPYLPNKHIMFEGLSMGYRMQAMK